MIRSRRLVIATFAIVLSLLTLIEGRVFYLQVIKSESFQETLRQYHHTRRESLVPRGAILDRNSLVLAASLPSRQVEVWRPNIDAKRAERLRAKLSPVFPTADLDLMSPPPEGDGKPKRFVLSKSLIDAEDLWTLERLKEERAILGVDIRPQFSRTYPQGELFGPLVGFVDADERGVCGIEKVYQEQLESKLSSRYLTRDAKNLEMFDVEDSSTNKPRGCDVVLTIDSRVQRLAGEAVDELVREHGAHRAVVIITHPKTGEILAMAQSPRFDPNSIDETIKTWRNFAVQDTYEPGSSFKPFTMAMALERGCVHPDQLIDCEGGSAYFGRRLVLDTKAMDEVPARDVIIHSSNVGMAKILQGMVSSNAKRGSSEFSSIRETLLDLGFGRASGLGIAGEMSGSVTDLANWSRNFTLVSVAFGYEISLSAVQMAQAFSVFANRGVLKPLRLVERLEFPDGHIERQESKAAKRVFSEATADEVVEMMCEVVDSGTGKACRLDSTRVAGKTGSSVPPKHLREKGTKTANFVCLAPASDPELLVLVNAHRDGKQGNFYGGEIAAPVAKKLLEQSLDVLELR